MSVGVVAPVLSRLGVLSNSRSRYRASSLHHFEIEEGPLLKALRFDQFPRLVQAL